MRDEIVDNRGDSPAKVKEHRSLLGGRRVQGFDDAHRGKHGVDPGANGRVEGLTTKTVLQSCDNRSERLSCGDCFGDNDRKWLRFHPRTVRCVRRN